MRFKPKRLIAKSWLLSRCYYRYRGAHLVGRPKQGICYFAYGANMDDSTFRIRRGIQPLECRSGRVTGYRLRFNLDGRPKGRSAPANLCPDRDAEVWGVLYRIRRRDLMRLDSTEGCQGVGIIISKSRPKIVVGERSVPSPTWLGVMRWMASRRCGIST